MKKYYFTCLLFLSFSYLGLFSQDFVVGEVLTTEGEPISYATVSYKGTKIGCVANVKGEFDMTLSDGYDTIAVASLGFKTQYLTNDDFLKLTTPVHLEGMSYELESYMVSGHSNYDESFTQKTGESVRTSSVLLCNGTKLSVWFPQVESRAMIKELRFFVAEICSDNKMVRIRVMTCDSLGKPDRDISPPMDIKLKKSLNKIKLKKQDIIIESDYCIVFESLSRSKECFLSKGSNNDYNVALSTIATEWPGAMKRYDNDWEETAVRTYKGMTSNFAPCVEVDLLY